MPLYSRPDYQETQPNWQQWLAQYNQQAQQRTVQQQRTTGAVAGGVAPTLAKAGSNPGQAGAVIGQTGADARAAFGPEGVGSEAQGRNFQSNPDNTYTEQAAADWKHDHTNGFELGSSALVPGLNNVRAYQSYKSFGKARSARDKYAAQVAAENAHQRTVAMQNWGNGLDPRIGKEMDRRRTTGSEMTEDEIRQMYGQLVQSDTATKLSGDVNNYFNDPQRQARQEQGIQDQRTQALRGVGEEFNTLNTKHAQNAASRGMLGSSVDLQEGGQLGRARDQASLGVENNASQTRYNNQLNDEDQRNQLLQLINSGDPSQSQQAASLLGRVGQGTADMNSIFGAQRQSRQIGDYTNQMQSQAYGSALNSGAQATSAYGPYLYAYTQRSGAGG